MFVSNFEVSFDSILLFVCRDVYVVGVVVVFQLVAEDVSVLLEIDSLKLAVSVSLKFCTSNRLCRSGCTASSASCFGGLSSVTVVIDGLDGSTDGSTELSLSAAVSRPTRQRRSSSAGLLGRWLAVESVVRWPIRGGDDPTHRGRPRSSSNHIDELLVRPPPEATPASAGRRHILVVKVPPDVL